jgi:two-component system, NtrC family, nitrogen regulation sensor histidine kinase NtrY
LAAFCDNVVFAFLKHMAPAEINKPQPKRSYRTRIVVLGTLALSLFVVIFSQQAFRLTFLRPESNGQTIILFALSALVFLLFLILTFVLLRTLLKLYAERRGGVLGSQFRTRMVLGALVLSFAPVIFLCLFSYGLMNRSVETWFSRPVQDVYSDTRTVAGLLLNYATENAREEARSLAGLPEVQRAFATGEFSPVLAEFRRHEPTLEGGFAIAIVDGSEEASFHEPDMWPVIRARLPAEAQLLGPSPQYIRLNGVDYTLGLAPVGSRGRILVGLKLPATFFSTVAENEQSDRRYNEMRTNRKIVRNTYVLQLLLLTVLLLFAATWFAMFLSKFVTQQVAALAAATQEISLGRFDYRIDVTSDDELGRLAQSFNRMAQELESNRRQLESSARSLADANVAIEQRRQHMETILESIPTGVLSLDAQRRVTHMNTALLRIFHALEARLVVGAPLDGVFPAEVIGDLSAMLRKADRMGSITSQMEIAIEPLHLDLAVTAAALHIDRQHMGYVLVFEDLSDLLKAQKQAAWREVARRVAHEIKNPLTPIALSAERIRRHLERSAPPDNQSLAVIQGCAETIGGAVETVRTLVDEFSTLARFPTAQPQPADINFIVQSALSLFEGRLDGIQVHTDLAPSLPKVLADPEAMKRVLANLVDNAAEAMQHTLVREVHMSTALLGRRDMVEIVVADTGPGVSQEMKERLFLPYFSTKHRGTGLGLAIVSRIIEDHHGLIRVEENSPVGTRFVIELPLALAEENGAANGIRNGAGTHA